MKHFLIFLISSFSLYANAQEGMVGKPAPNLSLTNIINYKFNNSKVAAFKGKPLVLDFWGTFCQPCVASFPKLDTLNSIFRNQLNIMLVNEEPVKKVRDFFTNYRRKNKLSLPSAVVSRGFFEAYNARFFPHYVWIDKDGIIKGVTNDIVKKDIEFFLEKGSVDRKEIVDESVFQYQFDKPLSSGINSNLNQLRNYSALTSRITGTNSLFYRPVDGAYGNRRVLMLNVPIHTFCRIAFGGATLKFGYPPSLIRYEFKDSSYNAVDKDHLFCYDLIVPEDQKSHLYMFMQQDLQRYFNIKGSFNQEIVKCLVLIKINNVEASKSDTSAFDMNYYWIKMTKEPISSFVDGMRHYLQKDPRPLIDSTGINIPIDLHVEAKLSDIPAVRKELLPYGLDIVEKMLPMNVLILKDEPLF